MDRRFLIQIVPLEPMSAEVIHVTRSINAPAEISPEFVTRMVIRDLEHGLEYLKDQLTEENVRRLIYGKEEK